MGICASSGGTYTSSVRVTGSGQGSGQAVPSTPGQAVPSFEIVGQPIDIHIESAGVKMTMQTGGSMLSLDRETRVETKDDALLGLIMTQATSFNRPVLKIVQKLEIPQMGAGAAASMMTGGAIEITTNYDCIFGAPTGQAIETFMCVVPIISQASVSVALFGSDVDVRTSGLDVLQNTLTQNFQNGYRMVAMLPGATSSSSQGGMGGVQSSSTGSLKLVFQKSDWQPYKESMFMTLAMDQHISATGMQCGPFDLLGELNKAGAVGWELSGIVPVPYTPQGAQQVGLGSTITTYHMATLSRRGNTPIQYKMVEIGLKVAMSGMTMKIQGDIMPAVRAAAASGWTFVGSIQMPARQSGFSSVMPVRLYFQSMRYY